MLRSIRMLGYFVTAVLLAQEWPAWGGNAAGTKYSPLKQIDRKNVKTLKVAWTFDTGDFSDGTVYPTRSAFEATPLVIDNVMYLVSPFGRLFALDAETGAQRWVFDPKVDRTVRVNLFANRGAAYWSDGKRKRLYVGDLEGRLHSIDAATGKPDDGFGKGGMADLAAGMVGEGHEGAYRLSSPVAVCGDVLVTGGWVSDGNPRGPSGDIRGFDALTGKERWRFHTVPRAGEPGHETWQTGATAGRGTV
jgi:quinoprotein glucose dehydrogenase